LFFPETLDLAGSADPPLLSLRGIIGMNHRRTDHCDTPAKRATSVLGWTIAAAS